MEFKGSQYLNLNNRNGDPNRLSADQNHEAAGQNNDEKLKLDEMIAKFHGKTTNLERLYVHNCREVLQCVAPNFMCSKHFNTLLTEHLRFPSLEEICNKIKKKPRNIFQKIPCVEIETVGFIQWLSLESKEPSFRRQKLERNHFLECVEFAELDLKSYAEEDEKEDEEMFQYLYLRYGTVFDNIADDLHEIQLTVDAELKEKEELEKARRRKKLLAPPSMEEIKEETAVEEAPTVPPPIIAKPRTTVDRMKVFRDIFDVDKRTVGTKKPFATQFVDNEPAMAIWLPFDRNIFGAVIPNDPAFHLQYDHILNVLSKQNIKTFNEFQRLVLNLIQYPFLPKEKEKDADVPLSNLLICAEPRRGFTTALSAVFIKRVAEYKALNAYGEAAKEIRFNKKPYVLIIALEDVDCLPLYRAFEPYLKGCQISVPNCVCTNVKFEQRLLYGCDILLIDRKKLHFLRSGEIDLCNLRHVVFLDIDRFIDGNQNLISEVHEFVQLALERKRYDSKISGKENLDVQYVFQTYHDFNGWDSFERLFYLTQPVNDNVALILQYDYKAYNLNQTQNG